MWKGISPMVGSSDDSKVGTDVGLGTKTNPDIDDY